MQCKKTHCENLNIFTNTDMITFPCAKINLGLNVIAKRPDGYHDLETVFYPIPLTDAIEVKRMHHDFPLDETYDICITGAQVEGNTDDNLVVKAYRLIAEHYDIPRVHIHLFKRIPMQAGLGGGSSDAAFMIRLLDEYFMLNMGNREMERYAARLGADCPFFITAEPAYATGIGDILQPVGSDEECCHYLNGYWIALVKPPVAVSTKEAYADITPRATSKKCREIVLQPIETWREELTNDFEDSIFPKYPMLAHIKESLYDRGAVYAAMSGSGSTLFGIFREKPLGIDIAFADCQAYVMQL